MSPRQIPLTSDNLPSLFVTAYRLFLSVVGRYPVLQALYFLGTVSQDSGFFCLMGSDKNEKRFTRLINLNVEISDDDIAFVNHQYNWWKQPD